MTSLDELTSRLTGGGFIRARDEARQLLAAARGDQTTLDGLLARRESGEPLAWVTGHATFCGVDVRITPGVYVPREQSEVVARSALDQMPHGGRAIDLCTGCGAIAALIADRCPAATVIATDLDAAAVACAQSNGVDARLGDLFAPVPSTWRGLVDVITAVVPYVPTPAMQNLQRDTFAFEGPLAYDGGKEGTDVLRRVVDESRAYLRTGGYLVCELGGDQLTLITPQLAELGYVNVVPLLDEDEVVGFAAEKR